MTTTELQQILASCLTSQHPAMQNAASLANNYTELVKTGQLSQDEYQELLLDIQRSVEIYKDMIELEIKEQFNSAINQLISMAAG